MASSIQYLKTACLIMASPIAPTVAWYYWSQSDRLAHNSIVKDDNSGPKSSLLSIDDLTSNNLNNGDVLLFSRDCKRCADSPFAALGCYFQQKALSKTQDSKHTYDHAAIIVPNPKTKGQTGTEPYVMEAVSNGGVVMRPFKERIGMSRSKAILLLPLNTPGERREGDDISEGTIEESKSEVRLKKIQDQHRNKKNILLEASESLTSTTSNESYESMHNSLTLAGGVASILGIKAGTRYYPAPLSPSCFLVVRALQAAGIATTQLGDKMGMNADCSTLIRDTENGSNDGEKRSIKLRPGYRFGGSLFVRNR